MPILIAKQKWSAPPNPKSLREKNRLLPIEETRMRRAMGTLLMRVGNGCADLLGRTMVNLDATA